MVTKRVVVTGLGALTPIGNNVADYWASLSKGVSGAMLITRFDTSKFKTKFACEVKNFDPTLFIDKKEIRRLDPFVQYAIACSDEAVADADISIEKIPAERIGVIWASGIGGISSFYQDIVEQAKGDGTPRYNPFFIPRVIVDIAAGHLSMRYGFRGINYATVSACASSNHALINACDIIRLGKADVILCGGSEASVNEPGIGGFNALHALSTRNDDPATASRPFDKDRDGFVLGEGAGALVLESLDHALARGAKIYAEMKGGTGTADAYHLTAPHPDGLGAANVMKFSLEDAQLNPTDIDYINVHGTSTPLGDIAELKAIRQVFGDHASKLHISSTKSMTGHLLGATGAIEAIASIMAINHGIIPPTINHFTDDPEIDPTLNLIFNQAVKKEINTVLSNTFGFGGHNASVILARYNT
ncbi:MAG: beta-ketoacyl-ACP synthase II [Flavobacteriales bacterium]|nr:beta-ketoacyl-ACP synthase II [Flavobacteriales bacterium]